MPHGGVMNPFRLSETEGSGAHLMEYVKEVVKGSFFFFTILVS